MVQFYKEMQLYDEISFRISKIVTCNYSTSFSIAVGFLKSDMRDAIYSIYGFVRIADEIVDSFHGFEKGKLLNQFEHDYYEAYETRICINPIIHSFQKTVRHYGIPDDLIQSFLNSMKSDLVKKGSYNLTEFGNYIYGSAESVGLMCLCVFTNGNKDLFDELRQPAMKLGAAFQKVNFLRDLRTDVYELSRSYFPDLEINDFNQDIKGSIIREIDKDFVEAMDGIKKLPGGSKLPVLIAYYYYRHLLEKIRNTPAEKLLSKRISVNNIIKLLLLNKAYLAVKMKII